MLKKSYLVIGSILFILLFSFNAKAYSTGYASVAGTDLNNNTFYVRGLNYWDLYPENYSEAGQDNYSAEWNVPENFQITNLQTGKYYTGVLRFRVQLSSANSGIQRIQPVYQNNEVTTGVYTYIQANTASYYQVDVVFDNYYCENESLGLPTILNRFTYPFNSEIGLTTYAQSFTLTLTIQSANIRSQTTPFENGLAGVITEAVDNSTALSVIAGWLYDIKTQDSTYYSQLMTKLVSIDSFVNSINTWTQNIYNKVANIDTNTTTILNDLETYITFMEGYIPYLQNISTNTLNTYNQLVTILTYLKNRPTLNLSQWNKYIYYQTDNNRYVLYNSNTSANSYYIKKEYNIEYMYLYNYGANVTNTRPLIIYLNEDVYNLTNGTNITNYVTRVINFDNAKTGWQYYTVDFQYNEKSCVVFMRTDDIKLYIGDGYTYSALMYYIESMMNMNQQQSEAVEQLESEYNSKDENSSQLLNGLGSLNLPEVNQGDFDILSNVDNTSKINFFGLLGLITHNNLVTTILLIIITGAIVGYALYGKK